jgi:hypothetical protein
MKRSLDETIRPRKNTLGASEFAATLNAGDDAPLMLIMLKKFTKVVQRERRLALLGKDDEDSDDENDDENDDDDYENHESTATNTNKKQKQEEWMKDSQHYNVPFVGTAVAKGDVGTVIANQWPCGLLRAYLTKSPMAVEFTSDQLLPPNGHVHKRLIRNKQGKMSHAIYKAYLEALNALLTAAVPTPGNKPCDKFLATILKDRLPAFISLLHEETGYGKGKSDSTASVGPLAAPVLDIFSQLAATSVGTAREMARTLDASIREGVFRLVLRQPKTTTAPTTVEPQTRKEQAATRLLYKTRAACLKLGAVLVEWNDPTTTSYVATSGSRERKIQPGLLYLALRFGLTDAAFNGSDDKDNDEQNEEFLETVARLLEAVRGLLPTKGRNKEDTLSRRALTELLAADALQHISRIATCAAKLVDFESVLTADDAHDDLSLLEEVGMQAQRLLFPLLADSSRSPFLSRISGKVEDKTSTINAQQIVKAMNELLSKQGSIPMQKFLVHILLNSPLLAQTFNRSLSIPDSKVVWGFLSQLGFVGRVLKDGPSVSSCIVEGTNLDITLSLLVLPCLKKQALSKALTSSNPLVVCEVLKTTIILLRRFATSANGLVDDIQALTEGFSARLVDVQAILNVRNKFDPFMVPCKINEVVNSMVCQALFWYAKVLPEIMEKFDWIKLLPEKASAFGTASPLVQQQILETISSSQRLLAGRISKKTSPAGLTVILEVMMKSKRQSVYDKTRSIAVQALLSMLSNENDSAATKDAFTFEVELWIDSLQPSTLKEFVSWCGGPDPSTFQHTILAAQAWKDSGPSGPMGTLLHTPILSAALSGFSKSANQDHISRIAGRCLLYHNSPLPLAALISSVVGGTKKTRIASLLCEYSHGLLSCTLENNARLLRNLLPAILSKTHFDTSDGNTLKILPATFEHARESEVLEACRICMHIILTMKDLNSQEIFQKGLRMMLRLFSKSNSAPWRIEAILEHSFFQKNKNLSAEKMLYYLLLFSKGPEVLRGVSGHSIALFDHDLMGDAKMDNTTLVQLLRIWLLKPFCQEMEVTKVGRILLHWSVDKENGTLVDIFLLNWLKDHAEQTGSSPVFSFDAWIKRVSCKTNSVALVTALEVSLSKACGKEDRYADFSSEPTNSIVSTCLRSQIIQINKQGPLVVATSMLGTLLSYDTCRFLPSITKLMAFKFDGLDVSVDQMRRLLDVGTFDEPFLSIARYQSRYGALNNGKELVTAAISRAVDVLRKSGVDTKVIVAADIFEAFIEGANEVDCNECFGAILQRVVAVDVSGHVHKRLVACAKYLVQRTVNSWPCRDTLALGFLGHCFGILPAMLKKRFRPSAQPQSDSKLVELLDAAASILGCIQVNLPSSIVAQLSADNVDNCIRSCMKYCVQEDYGEALGAAMGCVHLLQALLKLTVPEDVSIGTLLAQSTFLHPKMLLNMIVSHSKFPALLKSDEESQRAIKLALFQLVNSCIGFGNQPFSLENTVWKVLLSTYTASMSPQDCALRRILFAAAGCHDGYVPDLNEMRWKGASSGQENVDAGNGHWLWLTDAIDTVRVHTTLHQFPLHDSISEETADREVDAREEIKEEDSGNIDASDEDYDSAQIILEVEIKSTEREHSARDWQGRGQDIRYSPAFIVPLILGALESVVPDTPERKQYTRETYNSENESYLADESIQSNELEFVTMAQHLCEKGGLALSIASLCTRCPILREIAISALGLFVRATNSSTARDLTTWRSRPQLAVLLNSLQRGMAIRRAMFPSEDPKLPVLSAVFLAKASFIINKPGDPMYGPMNRYFLKIEQAHGAYDDINRLPGFIPFFCSSTDEGDQAKWDRIWALQFLKDAFVDRACYKMISSCHAPELIMSTLQGLTARSDDDVDLERTLLLETITRLVICGGKAAENHLIGRLGLLSWMVSFVVSDDVSIVLPTIDSRRACLELILAIVQATSSPVESGRAPEQFLWECNSLLQPILTLSASRDAGNDVSIIKELLCKVVFTLVTRIVEMKSQHHFVPTTNGIHAASALHTITVAPNEWKSRITWALCSVDMDVASEIDAMNLMDRLLGILPALMEHSHVLPVIGRIHVLAQTFLTAKYAVTAIDKLLTCRQICFSSTETTRQAWVDCLGTFLKTVDNVPTFDRRQVRRDAWTLFAALSTTES